MHVLLACVDTAKKQQAAKAERLLTSSAASHILDRRLHAFNYQQHSLVCIHQDQPQQQQWWTQHCSSQQLSQFDYL